MKNIVLLLSTALFLALMMSWFVAGKLVSAVPSRLVKPETNLPVERFTIKSQSGETLAGWHIDTRTRNGVIVLFHGIRGTRTDMYQRAELLYKNGYSVVLVDFQAHGESTGDRITLGYLEQYDVLASIAYAKARHQGQPVGMIGVSLGGVAALLASPQNVNALVIESAYPDIDTAVHNRVKERLGGFSWLPGEILLAQIEPRLGFSLLELRPIDRISKQTSPVFLISGVEDTYTTVEETERVFSRANDPKQLWLVKGVAHEDIFSARPEAYEVRVLSFFSRYMR